MIKALMLLMFSLLAQQPTTTSSAASDNKPLEKSAYFAFVGRDYIFTIEVVKPGVPLLNFVSMTDEEKKLFAKDIRLDLGNRKGIAKLLSVETGEFKQPMSVTSIAIHPRSSFGLRIDGEFGDVKELFGVTIRLGDEDLKLIPLSNYDFENLVLKVSRLNLGSPDFSDDWRVLRMEVLGSRAPARKRIGN
jgi:hypothetical protein